MIGRNLPKFTPAQPGSNRAFNHGIAITAQALNAPRSAAEKFGRMRGGSGIVVMNTPGGPVISAQDQDVMYFQITGEAAEDGGYPWIEVIKLKDGGFIPSGVKGTNETGADYFDPTYESQTGDTTLTADATTYFAQRDETSGQWLFDGKN